MKKFLLTLIVTMLTCIGAWAQGELVGEEWYKPTEPVSFNNEFVTPSSTFKVEENDDLLKGLGVGDQLVVYYRPIAAVTAQLFLKNSSNSSYKNNSNTDPFSVYEKVSNTDLTYKSMTVDSKLVSEFVTGGLYFTGDNVVAEQIRIVKAGETPGGETPANNFGTASSWSYADGTLTINLNASSDLQETNWGYGQSCPWASESDNISNVVLKPASDVEFNSNVLYIFFEGKAASTLDLSNLTADQVDQLKSNQNLDKIYMNRSKISLKLPEGYEYDSAAEPWSHYTVTGGTNTNGSGGGEGGDPEPGPAPAVVTTGHVTYATTLAANDVATINLAAEVCSDGTCDHSLATILSKASISTDDAFAKVIIKGAATSDFETQVVNLNTKALVLADVTGLTVSSSLTNSYVKNLVLPNGLHKDVVTAENLAGFTKLESAASVESLSETKTTDHYYYTPDGGSKTEFTGVVVDKGEGVYEGTVTEHPTVELNHVSTVNTYVNNYYNNEVTEIAEDATSESDVYVDGGVAKVNRQKVFLDNQKIEYYKDEALSQREYNTYVETEEGDNYGKRYYWNGLEKVYEVYVKYIYQDPENNHAYTQYSGDVVPVGDDFYGYLEYDPAKEYALTTKYNYTYKFDPADESEEAKPISFNEPKTEAQVNRDVTYTLIKETNDDIVDLGQSLVAYVKEEGHLAHTLQHVPAFNPTYREYAYWYTSPGYGYEYSTSNVKRVTLAGNLNAWDLNKQYNYRVTAEGHYTSTEDKDYASFTGSVMLTHLDLEKAVFNNQADMQLNGYSLFQDEPSYEQFITLPTDPRMTTIPASCLENLRGVKNLCIPCNYTVLKANAFFNSGIRHIYTTSPSDQNINGVELKAGDPLDIDVVMGHTAPVNSWTLPPALTDIETGVFITTATDEVTDVYINNPVAPRCAKDAFDSPMYYGNNGFKGNSAHPIQRSNYKNGTKMFAILHYPTDCTLDEQKHYTDVTRKYSLADETGNTDDFGRLFMWPTHEELNYVYQQAIAGVLWDAWIDATTWAGTPKTYASKEDARAEKNKNDLAPAYSTIYDDDVNSDVEYDYAYAGWHQFVLVGSQNYQKPNEDIKYWNVTKYKDNDWYTICIPVSLSKKELLNMFGDPTEGSEKYPEVRTLAGVVRNKSQKHITLQLSSELLNNGGDVKYIDRNSDGSVKLTVNAGKLQPTYTTATGDDPIVIEANKPYFIKPILNEDEVALRNAGERAIEYLPKDEDAVADGDAQKPVIDYFVYALNAAQTKYLNWKDEESEAVPSANPYKYYYVGTYEKTVMPKNCYYLGVSGGKSTFFRNTKDSKSWGQYTSIIGGVSNGTPISYTGGTLVSKDVRNFEVNFSAEDDYTFSKDTPAASKAVSFTNVFMADEDGTVTGIMLPNESGSMTFVPTGTKIYNINGQHVSNSIENLHKGIYIINGKKYSVK